MREPTPEFKAMLDGNVWHGRSEIDEFVRAIKELSEEPKWTPDGEYAPDSNRWSWAKNHACKYVELRFDMRDGGFVLRCDKGRISLDQLRWQRGQE